MKNPVANLDIPERISDQIPRNSIFNRNYCFYLSGCYPTIIPIQIFSQTRQLLDGYLRDSEE